MERAPWQPAVPNGLCSSALRSTVGKGANLTRVQYVAAVAAAAAGAAAAAAVEAEAEGWRGAERQRS